MPPPGKLRTGEQLNSRALFTHRVCLVLPESRTLTGICGPGKGLRRPEAVCSGCTFAPRMAPPQEHRSLGTGRPEDVTERDPVGRALTGRAPPLPTGSLKAFGGYTPGLFREVGAQEAEGTWRTRGVSQDRRLPGTQLSQDTAC